MAAMPLVEASSNDFLDCFEDAAVTAAKNMDITDPRIASGDPKIVVTYH